MPKEHKAVMKTDVAEHFISKFTQENDIILDCFFWLRNYWDCSKRIKSFLYRY